MLKGKPGAAVMALLAGCGFYAAVRSLATGAVNFGGGRARDYFVSWANSPALFVFGIVMFVALGAGCGALAWKFWNDDGD
jgi:hypothetical protein